MWLILLIITFIVEIITLSLVTIWFSAGALLALILQFAGVSILGQVVGFILTSLLTFLLFRPILIRHIKSPGIRTNADSLIGKTGRVVVDITPLSFGQVEVRGQVWTAKSIEGVDLKEGTIVDILGIEGVKLIVRKSKGGL